MRPGQQAACASSSRQPQALSASSPAQQPSPARCRLARSRPPLQTQSPAATRSTPSTEPRPERCCGANAGGDVGACASVSARGAVPAPLKLTTALAPCVDSATCPKRRPRRGGPSVNTMLAAGLLDRREHSSHGFSRPQRPALLPHRSRPPSAAAAACCTPPCAHPATSRVLFLQAAGSLAVALAGWRRGCGWRLGCSRGRPGPRAGAAALGGWLRVLPA